MKNLTDKAFPNRTIICMLAGLICSLFLIASESAFAQEPVSIKPSAYSTEPATIEDLKTLAAKIESGQGRKQLLGQIRALIALQNKMIPHVPERSFSVRLNEAISKIFEKTSQTLSSIDQYIPRWEVLASWVQNNIPDRDDFDRLCRQAIPIVLILVLAWISEYIVEQLLAGFRKRIEDRACMNQMAPLALTFARAALRFCALVMFTIVALSAFFFLKPGAPIGNITIQIFTIYITGRVFVILTRMVLAPSVPALRLVPLRDESATALFSWLRCLLFVTLIGYLLASTALLFGLPAKGFSVLMDLLAMVLLVMMIIGILRNRTTLTLWIRGPEEQGGALALQSFSRRVRSGLAAVWHILAILYLVSVFLVWWQDIDGGFIYLVRGTLLSAILLFIARLVIQFIRNRIALKISENDSLTWVPAKKAHDSARSRFTRESTAITKNRRVSTELTGFQRGSEAPKHP
ncbi:MAG: hypothetical protein V1844_20635, partial [Pseudomonadota bacterium]